MSLLFISLIGLAQMQAMNIQAEISKLAEVKTVYAQEEKLLTTAIIDPHRAWKDKLRKCESGGNDEALNPKDTNNKRSVGRYQFQDATFEWLSKKYNIKTTDIWNGDEQELLLDRMIKDKEINLRNQFPLCVKKIGLPTLVE